MLERWPCPNFTSYDQGSEGILGQLPIRDMLFDLGQLRTFGPYFYNQDGSQLVASQICIYWMDEP